MALWRWYNGPFISSFHIRIMLRRKPLICKNNRQYLQLYTLSYPITHVAFLSHKNTDLPTQEVRRILPAKS
ncbi:hypothetical protein XENTR_v10019004 [Xenopus tropicalis]|nr:hypothetical protein XENTR_v10019004 [Xenopus tropicalis]